MSVKGAGRGDAGESAGAGEGLVTLRGHWSFGADVGGWRALGLHALGGGTMFALLLVAALMPPWAIGPIVVAAVCLLLAISVPTEYFRRHGPIVRSVAVSLDDAGLRVTVERSSHYIPVADAAVALSPDDPRELWVPGPLYRLRVVIASDALPIAGAFAAALERHRARASSEDEPAELAPLRRGADTLDAWTARVLQLVEAERRTGHYRAASAYDDERLRELLLDAALAPTLRAAASHALARLAPAWLPELAPRVASAPPIVAAMLYAGAGEPLRACFDAVAPFLPRRDRRAAERLAAQRHAPALAAPL